MPELRQNKKRSVMAFCERIRTTKSQHWRLAARSTRRASVLAGVTLLLAACADEPAGPQAAGGAQPPPAVLVAPVIERDVASGNSYIGRTSALQQVDLVARVQGVLEQRDFIEGTEVEKGQLLFEIEPDQYRASRAVAQAAVSNAEAVYEKARKYYNRLKRVASGGVSASALEQAENDLAIAAAQMEQARAQLLLTELDEAYTQIKAPISGRIGEAAVDVGNLVGPSTGTLASIVQLDPIHVNFAISERIAIELRQSRLASGQSEAPSLDWFTPRLTLSNGTEYGRPGKLDFVASDINRATGSLEVRAVFPNPDGLLRPGQYVNVSVQRGEAEPKPVVPQASVQQDQGGYFVLVVDGDSKVEQRRITVGDRLEIDWVVESGLEAGEQVIFEGIQKVRPGAAVNAQAADPRAGLQP